MRRYKFLLSSIVLFHLWFAVSGQSNISGISVVFEASNREGDKHFSDAVISLLQHDIRFSGIMEVIRESEWVHYKDKEYDPIVIRHFEQEHPKTELIFRFILVNPPQHVSGNMRHFRIQVMDLSGRRTRELFSNYIYLMDNSDGSASDAYDDYVNQIMKIPRIHMEKVLTGTYKRNILRIFDNSAFGTCNNYYKAMTSLVMDSRLHKYFYVILEPRAVNVNSDNLVGLPCGNNLFRFQLIKAGDILISPPVIIDCNSLSSVCKSQIDTYSNEIQNFCHENGYTN